MSAIAVDELRRRALEASALIGIPGALLTSSHLAALGLSRRAIAAVFTEAARSGKAVYLPGHTRPLVRADFYVALLERCTFRDDAVRP